MKDVAWATARLVFAVPHSLGSITLICLQAIEHTHQHACLEASTKLSLATLPNNFTSVSKKFCNAHLQ